MATKKRKGVKAKAVEEASAQEVPVAVAPVEVAPVSPPVAELGWAAKVLEASITPIPEGAVEFPLVESEVELPQPEESLEVTVHELTVTVTPRVFAFLKRVAAGASQDNLYTSEEVVSDILEEWCNIYENEEHGGIERIHPVEEAMEEDYPEFAEAFEDKVRS